MVRIYPKLSNITLKYKSTITCNTSSILSLVSYPASFVVGCKATHFCDIFCTLRPTTTYLTQQSTLLIERTMECC